jgi:hypothetical protein
MHRFILHLINHFSAMDVKKISTGILISAASPFFQMHPDPSGKRWRSKFNHTGGEVRPDEETTCKKIAAHKTATGKMSCSTSQPCDKCERCDRCFCRCHSRYSIRYRFFTFEQEQNIFKRVGAMAEVGADHQLKEHIKLTLKRLQVAFFTEPQLGSTK